MKLAKLYRWFALLLVLCLALPQSQGYAAPQLPQAKTPIRPVVNAGGGDADAPDERSEWFYGWREAGDPNAGFTLSKAADLRAQAAQQMISAQKQAANGPQALNQQGGAWSPLGPNPIVQQTSGSTFHAVSGRVSALAVRSSPPYTIYLGAAQGGVWEYSDPGVGWVPMTDQLGSLAIGAIALAPSNEDIIYVGTGEGNLSSDSYFGNGLLKSTDGGATFAHIGGSSFNQVSFARIAVDPGDPNHLYAAIISGRSGRPSLPPPAPPPNGIYESSDGGSTWQARLANTISQYGATDIVIDPQNPSILYAAFLTTGIYKSSDGGQNWVSLMTKPGLPINPNYTFAPSRFALGISHPAAAAHATLYTGFDWYSGGTRQAASVYKSSDDGNTWTQTDTASLGDYCGSQCWYDNVIGVDPSNPDIVFALGLFDYNTSSGGVFRSTDGGQNWVDLGWRQHPDFHAIAIRADAPSHVVIGSDGGVWSSSNYGGRTAPGSLIDANDWVDLNGTIDPTTAVVTTRTNLQITQFNSLRQNPTIPGRIYGGAQDNGTSRRDAASATWFDVASGDGGQALVDPYDAKTVYNTYYDISPYRFSDAGVAFNSNISINTGIDSNDRSGFYVPFEIDPWQTQRLYIGSYRMYRSDNRGDLWQPISPDLTTGCTSGGTSPTGFSCVVTAIGVTAGGPYVYAGTGDGKIWLTSNAYDATPSWSDLTKAPLPLRPISRIAVDSSNYKVAYVTFSGFNAATPAQPGHVFRTTNGGQTWSDISANLSDISVNSIALDPVSPSTIYLGTDVGPMVSSNSGGSWQPLGSGFPIVATSEINVNPYTGLLRASTYGRGAWELPAAPATPALQLRKQAADVPVGPGSQLTYTITVRNIGSAAASSVNVLDVLPASTTFVSASNGGALTPGGVAWTGLSVPAASQSADGFGSLVPGDLNLTLVVQLDLSLSPNAIITNNQLTLTASGGIALTASPVNTTVGIAQAISLLPASQTDGGKKGESIRYSAQVKNLGYQSDHFSLSATGSQWPVSFWNSTFSGQISATPSLAAGETVTIGIEVAIPTLQPANLSNTVTIHATSQANPAISKSATITTLAANADILLVDNDAIGSPQPVDVQAYYRDLLAAGHYHYDLWDLESNPTLPQHYLNSHKAVIWFTGGSYPGPIIPYESELASYLDNGGRLFLSGQDLLDQAAGLTSFVKNYLHVDWNDATQNDKLISPSLSGVPANPLTAGLGPYTVCITCVGLDDFPDLLTPTGSAKPALEDSQGTRALTVTEGNYKIWFLAFPFEAITSQAAQVVILQHAMQDFGVTPLYSTYLPVLRR